MKILLVEDEKKIASLVELALSSQKYLVTTIHDGSKAKETVEAEDFDLAILDVMLPGASGFEICRYIRELGLKYPVIILTARDAVHDKVAGLDAGADDYLTKPFELEELFARVRALGRRETLTHFEILKCGPLELNANKREITARGNILSLAKKEFQFLEYLLRNQEKICSRIEISEHLWGNEYLYTPQQEDMLNVLVSRVRKKIAERAGGRNFIKTVSKQGYRLNPDV